MVVILRCYGNETGVGVIPVPAGFVNAQIAVNVFGILLSIPALVCLYVNKTIHRRYRILLLNLVAWDLCFQLTMLIKTVEWNLERKAGCVYYSCATAQIALYFFFTISITNTISISFVSFLGTFYRKVYFMFSDKTVTFFVLCLFWVVATTITYSAMADSYGKDFTVCNMFSVVDNKTGRTMMYVTIFVCFIICVFFFVSIHGWLSYLRRTKECKQRLLTNRSVSTIEESTPSTSLLQASTSRSLTQATPHRSERVTSLAESSGGPSGESQALISRTDRVFRLSSLQLDAYLSVVISSVHSLFLLPLGVCFLYFAFSAQEYDKDGAEVWARGTARVMEFLPGLIYAINTTVYYWAIPNIRRRLWRCCAPCWHVCGVSTCLDKLPTPMWWNAETSSAVSDGADERLFIWGKTVRRLTRRLTKVLNGMKRAPPAQKPEQEPLRRHSQKHAQRHSKKHPEKHKKRSRHKDKDSKHRRSPRKSAVVADSEGNMLTERKVSFGYMDSEGGIRQLTPRQTQILQRAGRFDRGHFASRTFSENLASKAALDAKAKSRQVLEERGHSEPIPGTSQERDESAASVCAALAKQGTVRNRTTVMPESATSGVDALARHATVRYRTVILPDGRVRKVSYVVMDRSRELDSPSPASSLHIPETPPKAESVNVSLSSSRNTLSAQGCPSGVNLGHYSLVRQEGKLVLLPVGDIPTVVQSKSHSKTSSKTRGKTASKSSGKTSVKAAKETVSKVPAKTQTSSETLETTPLKSTRSKTRTKSRPKASAQVPASSVAASRRTGKSAMKPEPAALFINSESPSVVFTSQREKLTPCSTSTPLPNRQPLPNLRDVAGPSGESASCRKKKEKPDRRQSIKSSESVRSVDSELGGVRADTTQTDSLGFLTPRINVPLDSSSTSSLESPCRAAGSLESVVTAGRDDSFSSPSPPAWLPLTPQTPAKCRVLASSASSSTVPTSPTSSTVSSRPWPSPASTYSGRSPYPGRARTWSSPADVAELGRCETVTQGSVPPALPASSWRDSLSVHHHVQSGLTSPVSAPAPPPSAPSSLSQLRHRVDDSSELVTEGTIEVCGSPSRDSLPTSSVTPASSPPASSLPSSATSTDDSQAQKSGDSCSRVRFAAYDRVHFSRGGSVLRPRMTRTVSLPVVIHCDDFHSGSAAATAGRALRSSQSRLHLDCSGLQSDYSGLQSGSRLDVRSSIESGPEIVLISQASATDNSVGELSVISITDTDLEGRPLSGVNYNIPKD